jgi:membrane-bound lytic murein transglycosylase D
VTRTDSVSLASQTARTALQSLNPAPEDTAPIPPSLTMAPAAVAIDPLNPERALDLDDVQADADLWARVRRGFAISDLDTELVRKAEQYYAARPDYVDRMTERGGRYLFHVIEEIEKRGMPAELALLPFIESAFNPQAMSTAKASGMWQFVPATGKDFALKQSVFRDDRRDVLASTRAALDYLGRLHNQFGDWHLALAAYNWGQGNVQRAIARNEKAGLPTDYLNLRMPDETRYYVPKLQAIKNIVNRPAAFALSLPALKNHPYFLSVPIERDIDLELAARLAGVGVDEFKQLNPQMNKPVILAAGTEQVLLPYDNAARFIANLRAHPGPLASWTAWVAPRTLRPGDAARQVGMTEAQLREINRIPPRMLVKSGSTLLVPRSAARTEDVSEHLADNAVMALTPDTPPLRRVGIKAGKRGDTVAAVAQRYRVSAAQVAQWNKVSTGASFKAGATIVVYLPQAPARVATSAARSTARPVTTRPAATTKPAAKPVKPVRVAQG